MELNWSAGEARGVEPEEWNQRSGARAVEPGEEPGKEVAAQEVEQVEQLLHVVLDRRPGQQHPMPHLARAHAKIRGGRAENGRPEQRGCNPEGNPGATRGREERRGEEGAARCKAVWDRAGEQECGSASGAERAEDQTTGSHLRSKLGDHKGSGVILCRTKLWGPRGSV